MSCLLIAAPHKSSGKTTVTLGLCAALTRRGYTVQPFKKGPDYIDPMWLGAASARPAYNLDFNTMSRSEISQTFVTRSAGADVVLVEGNMGLFDSLDVEGSQSNAEMAKLLGIPVLLVVDVRGATRSVAAMIRGFLAFDPELSFAGVILNNVAGDRHANRLAEVMARYLPQLPLIGMVHRNRSMRIDERHLGLVPSNEASRVTETLEAIAQQVTEKLDLALLRRVGAPLPEQTEARLPTPSQPPAERSVVRIGIAQDEAFAFYYHDDLDALRMAGAELVPVDLLRCTELPALDGLFIGGGFPEACMESLESNLSMRNNIRDAIERGLPCYAECGGLMYLCRSIRWKGDSHTMCGVIPADVVMHRKPVGRGYIQLRETGNFPWPGCVNNEHGEFNAHEFHHSSLENLPESTQFAYTVLRGTGIDGQHDGIVYRNLLASYAHLRDSATNHWAARFVSFVRECSIRTKNQ